MKTIKTFEELKKNKLFLNILDESRNDFIPVLLNDTARILFNTIKQQNSLNVLEIGTAVGYSGNIILQANENCFLTTIEKDKERINKAKNNFELFNVYNRVRQINDDAMNTLKQLSEANESFDFIFLDGPKGQYHKYIPYLKKLLCTNGILFVDDIFFHNEVLSHEKIIHKHRTMVNNLRIFLNEMNCNPNFSCEIINVADGILIATKK